MIGKLFSRFCLLSLVVAFSFAANAQTTTINTNYTSAVVFGNAPNTAGAKMCVTFTVTNGNSYPIVLTEVSQYHMSSLFFANWGNVSNNGANYELWATTSSLSGPANVTTGGGWTNIENTSGFSAGANGPAPIFQNMTYQIPASTTVRFCVVLNDTLAVNVAVDGSNNIIPTAPTFFSANGVVLTSAENAYLGQYPNANQYGDTIGFWGGIKFESLKPPTTAFPKYQVCLNGNITIEANADPYYVNPTFTWYKGTSTTPVFVGKKFTITGAQFTDSGDYFIEVTGTNTTHTSSKTKIFLEVVSPDAPVVTGKFNYCLNEPFEYVTVHGGSAKWYYTETGGSPIPVIPTINTSTPNTLFHWVSITNALGCESRRTLVKYNAAPKPAPPIVTTPIYYCEDVPSEQLRAIGDTLSWYYQETGGIPSAIAPTPNTSKLDSFQYYVTQKIDGCESDRNKIDVVVTFRPNGQILVDKDEICVNDTIELNYYGSAFPGSGYLWDLAGGTRTNTGNDQGPIRLRLDSAWMAPITLRVGHTGCFSELYTQLVGVKPRPTGTILAKDDLCLAQSDLIGMVDFTKTIDDFAWDFDGGVRTHFTTDQGPYGVHWATPGIKSISVVLTDSGCTTEIIDTVLVHEKPDASIVAEYAHPESYNNNINYSEGDTICSDDSLKVAVNTIDISATYQWTPSIYFKAHNDIPVTYTRVNRADTIVLRVEDEFGCYNTDSLFVPTRPCCDVYFPNAFTPNNDGQNDYFRPITIGNREIKTFRVVNRWGQTVYETTNPVKGWDGTLNGKKLDLGTYFYLVSYKCDDKLVDQAGEVILIR